MIQLKVFDQKSIDYKNAKSRIGYKVFETHDCDCEECTIDKNKCPYCDSSNEPDDDDNGLVKCVDFEELAYEGWWTKDRDETIITNFEKENETN